MRTPVIGCNTCGYKNKRIGTIDACEFCKSTGLPQSFNRIHVPEIKIIRMNQRIKDRFGAPIYAQG